MTIKTSDINSVRVITLNHKSIHNPFSEALEDAMKAALVEADHDTNISAIVVYGGDNRSFSAGGDFNEVRNLKGGAEVDRWIDRVIDLYQTVLNVKKPTVAAIDGYAIGMGFQFAMMFDTRIMSSTGKFIMPELKHGIGCSLGAQILSHCIGYNAMKSIVYSCDELDAAEATQLHLADSITPPEQLLSTAISEAQKLSTYPTSSFRSTKKVMNHGYFELLETARKESKEVHRLSFGAGDAQQHFNRVLKTTSEIGA